MHEELIDNNHQGPAAVMNIKWLNFKHLSFSGGWLKVAKLRKYSYSSQKYLKSIQQWKLLLINLITKSTREIKTRQRNY